MKIEINDESSDSDCNSITISRIPFNDDNGISDDKEMYSDVSTSNLDKTAEGLAQTQRRKPARR